MATYTTYYNLKKPQATDTTEIITDLNSNSDTIDNALYAKVDKDTDATENNIAKFDINKNLVDSAIAAVDVSDAITKKHTQGTDTTLGTMTADINMNSHKLTSLAAPSAAGDSIRQTTKITEANLEDAVDKKHKIYISTSDPSGGSDGEVWFKYTA